MKALRVTLATMTLAALLGLAGWSESTGSGALVAGQPQAAQSRGGKPAEHGFEVWIADQSDTRPGFGGQILIYEGARLYRKHAGAGPADRPARSRRRASPTLCRAATGRNPVRPHMILFNNEHTHAVLSFVASGHVVIFDAEVAHAAEVLRDDRGQHGNPAGACGVSGAGRLLHPGRQPERQAAGAHRHQLQDQHLHPQSRRHARSGDVHDAQRAGRASTRTCGRSTGRSARSSIRAALRIRHAARRRPVRGRRHDHADGHRRRVRQGDGERQRLRRHRGAGPHVHQLGRQPGERVVRPIRIIPTSTGSTSTGFRCPAIRRSNAAQHPRAGARAVARAGCPTRTASRRPSATAISG